MKFIKWKSLIYTCIICLLPILLGLALWERLPERIAVHFNFYNEPDNFASKGFAVFGLPLIMMLLQIFCCVIYDINVQKYGKRRKTGSESKWIIPFVAVVVQIVTLGYSLGRNVDVRWAILIIAAGLCAIYGIKAVKHK